MRLLIAITFWLFLFMGSCQSQENYVVSLDSKYEGWIYLLKSTDSLVSNVFYPDSLGIVYLPEHAFDKKYSIKILQGDSFPERQKFQYFDSEFYDNNNRKTVYSKFYFPFTTGFKSEKLYEFNGNKLPAFKYFYYSGIIDTNRLSK